MLDNSTDAWAATCYCYTTGYFACVSSVYLFSMLQKFSNLGAVVEKLR